MANDGARELLVLAIALTGVTLGASTVRAQDDTTTQDAPAQDDTTTQGTTAQDDTTPLYDMTAPAPERSSSTTTSSAAPERTTSSTTTSSSARTSRSAPPTTPPEEPAEEDDGRDVDFIWLEVEGGVSYVNLVAFRNANFAGGDTDVFREVTGTGPMVGAAVGFRVYWLAVGARVTFASYDVFQIGTVGADVQLRFPIPIIEPYIRVGAGYAWEGDANYANPSMSSTYVNGWSFDAALGFDIFLTNWLTLGAGAGLDVLNLTRQKDPTQPCMGVTDFCPSMDGDSLGFQIRGFAQLGLHF